MAQNFPVTLITVNCPLQLWQSSCTSAALPAFARYCRQLNATSAFHQIPILPAAAARASGIDLPGMARPVRAFALQHAFHNPSKHRIAKQISAKHDARHARCIGWRRSEIELKWLILAFTVSHHRLVGLLASLDPSSAAHCSAFFSLDASLSANFHCPAELDEDAALDDVRTPELNTLRSPAIGACMV